MEKSKRQPVRQQADELQIHGLLIIVIKLVDNPLHLT